MKPVFKTSDGQDFDTAEAAKRHERLVNASAELEVAVRHGNDCLGETAKTADGQWFDMKRSNAYWIIRNRWHATPFLQEVSIWPHHAAVETERQDGRLVVREYDSDRQDYVSYSISELYADRREAEKAMLQMFRDRHAEMAEQILTMEAELKVG